MNEGVLFESLLLVLGEPLLVIVCHGDGKISVEGFVASTWEVKSLSVGVLSELDRAVDTFIKSCDLGPFDGIVGLKPVSTRES